MKFRHLPTPAREPTACGEFLGHLAVGIGLADLLVTGLAYLVVESWIPGNLFLLLSVPYLQLCGILLLPFLYLFSLAADWLGATGLSRIGWWLFWPCLGLVVATPTITVCFG
ncbi:MAG: hypothetical protein D6724_11050 [Armatimonadetes bacterium]|nr:MAG: hypothetical protein D6724_11050 [Armatimonadota bacterium]